MIRTEIGVNKNPHNAMSVLPDLRQSSAYRAYESYTNPRLENKGINYLSPNHIEELRRDSEQSWHPYGTPVEFRGGRLVRMGFVTEQGYTYDTLVGIPDRPECSVPVIGTTAWTTSLRGHNEHLVRNLTRAGNYVLYVGAEGSYIHDEPVTPKSPISLASSAAAVLTFSHHMVQSLRDRGHDLDEVQRFVVGESRGAMIAEGIDALAKEFGQTVLFSDQVAPCLPEKLDSLKDICRLTEQIAKEPREMYRLLGSLTLSRLRYYPATLDARLDCLRHQLVIGGALFSGETGALSQHAPDTTLKHITVFSNDFASNRDWWDRRYGTNELVRITPLHGGHMTLADLETLKYVIGRNKVAQEFINSGQRFNTSLFDLSHERARLQHPTQPPHPRHARHAAA